MRNLTRILTALAILAAPVLAGVRTDDVLLTREGTLFVAEVLNEESLPEAAEGHSSLRLRIEENGEPVAALDVPASLTFGHHGLPELAWDDQSETLFLFWVRAPYVTATELLLCSYKDGVFSEPTAVDGGIFRYRDNLRVSVTRYVRDEDGNRTARLAVHAVWWDSDGEGERARYALFDVQNGSATITDVRDLIDYAGSNLNPEPLLVGEGFDRDLLRHPAIFPNQALDGVEVVFADWETNRLNRIELSPVIADSVLKPPIGVWGGDIGGPVMERVSVSSEVTLIAGSKQRGDLVLYTVNDGAIEYLHYDGETWSHTQSLRMNEQLTESIAVQALRRLVHKQ